MRADAAQADRDARVRNTARAWKRARIADEHACDALERTAPDDRRRLGPVLRTLAFAFTLVAVVAGLALVLLLIRSPHDTVNAWLILSCGLGLLWLTEILTGRARLADAGIESATELGGALLLLGGSAWLLLDTFSMDSVAMAVLCALGVSIFATAAVRWGSSASALLSMVSLGLLLAQTGEPRLAWTAVAIGAAPFGLWLAGRPSLSPAHRRASLVAAAVAIAGLYLAWHVGSWDTRLIEHDLYQSGWPRPARPPLPRETAVAATALLPLIVTILGVRTRRRALWLLGIALTAVSLITLRVYVHLAPVWLILVGSGGTLILAALALRRWLEGGADHERAGFTARPLADEGRRLGMAEIAVTAALGSASADRPGAASPTDFRGAGGRGGGGGATGDF